MSPCHVPHPNSPPQGAEPAVRPCERPGGPDGALAFAKGVYAAWLHENGYRRVRDLGDGRYACLWRLMFTCALITGRWFDYDCTEDRWCYHDAEAAAAALDAWEATGWQGEPKGWHRHPDTGRRVDDQGREYVAP